MDPELLYRRYARALEGRSLPVAICDLTAFDANAEALVGRARGKPIRVASKSLRCRALLARVLRRPGYRGVLAFSAREAAFLADQGQDDIVLAYPTLDRVGLTAMASHVAEGRRIVCVVDSSPQVAALAAVARAVGTTIPIAIDVDVSTRLPGLHFGVRRSPLHSLASVLSFAREVRGTRGLRLVGVQAYEAQLAGLPDTTPGQAAFTFAVAQLKRISARDVAHRRRVLVEAFRREGIPLDFVNGGGTGSLETTSRDDAVTEVSAGSGLFGPTLFDRYRAFRPEPALLFALEVVRRPRSGLVTCLGGGYVASGAVGSDRLPTPYLPPGAELLSAEGAGEVQTPLSYRGELPLGAPFFFRPAKAGEVCERFSSLLLVEGERIVAEVPTYRGEGQTFL